MRKSYKLKIGKLYRVKWESMPVIFGSGYLDISQRYDCLPAGSIVMYLGRSRGFHKFLYSDEAIFIGVYVAGLERA